MNLFDKLCCRIVVGGDYYSRKVWKYLFILTLFAVSANARELTATREKVTVLESALKSKDDTIREIQETAKKNENDLREAIRRTESELSRTNGMLTAREAEVVRQSAIITAMIPMLRRKSIGIINF
jgi:peptidoglycan hydrolase CwlO-like protein